LIAAILKPPASSVQLIRTWLLELFARGVVQITTLQVKKLEQLPSVLDKRQLYVIRSRTNHKNFFRRHKASFGQLSPFEQPAFILGASCLPNDEYETWLTTLKPTFSAPTGHRFLKWVQINKQKIISKVVAGSDDHSE
jgi:hypothetical protein